MFQTLDVPPRRFARLDRHANRRGLILRSVVLVSLAWNCLAVTTTAHGNAGEARSHRPNVIFVMVDDMGYGDLGCYGQRQIRTPNIDALAREGIRMTDVYAGSPVCAPSRSVLMTGQHAGHTTVRGNTGIGGVRGLAGRDGRVPLKSSDVTIARMLRDAGYATAMTGKWGLGEPGTTGLPSDHGFDRWFGFLNQKRAHNHYADFLWLDRERYPIEANSGGKQAVYTHDLFTRFALDFIADHVGHVEPRSGERVAPDATTGAASATGEPPPFFLYLPYTVPHDRYQIPTTHPYTQQPWTMRERVYAAMITRMDRDVGKIVALLESAELADNTVVFVCSDNGAAERWEGRFDSSGPLRGRKRDLYEGGLRTPMVVRWPDEIPAGVTSDTPWSFADVMPTLAELAKTSPPPNIDGVSVVATLRGREQPELEDRLLYWEFFERDFQQAGRRGPWKAVRRGPDRPVELYNLREDVAESNDVADANPELVGRFIADFKHARTPSPHWPTPAEPRAE